MCFAQHVPNVPIYQYYVRSRFTNKVHLCPLLICFKLSSERLLDWLVAVASGWCRCHAKPHSAAIKAIAQLFQWHNIKIRTGVGPCSRHSCQLQAWTKVATTLNLQRNLPSKLLHSLFHGRRIRENSLLWTSSYQNLHLNQVFRCINVYTYIIWISISFP